MYFLTVSNSGCNASDSIHVTLNHLDLDLPIDTTFCSDSILIVANTTAGTFVWNTGSTQNQIWVSQPGTYTVTVTSGGCSQSDSVNVIMSQQNLDLGNDTIICGTSFTIDAGNFDTYIWSNGASSSSINVSSTGVYFVTATDNQGCSYMDSLDVIIDTLELDIGLDTTICFGDSIVLKDYYLGLNSNYLWSTGSIEDSIIIYSPGHYWLQSANSACKIIDSINVIVMDESIDLGEDRMSCEGEKVTLNNNLNTLVQWNDSIFAFSLEVESGVYWANYVNAAGCMSADTVIIERQKNIFSVLSDTALCLKDGYLVTLDDQIEAPVWQDGSVGEYYLVNAPGEYSFIGEMAGCPVSDTIFITEKGCELIVPNAFSPNNDGLNDFFSIYGEIAGLEGLFIYNRWGDLIFETNDTNHAWDGTHSGEQCQEGVYVVKIAYQTLSNDFEEYYGHLTLLR
ncbi:MAG: gliding motility-associated C-terminal domain-containing protein, partial [Flavobacteriales bacterium]|nr:gliding motility-associated C-terminal domain-containing protein [Flavobacteriales bacterium]